MKVVYEHQEIGWLGMVSTSRVPSYDPSLVVPVVDKGLAEGTPEAGLLPEDWSLDT